MAVPATKTDKSQLQLQPLTLASSTSMKSIVSGELSSRIAQELAELESRVNALVEPKLSITVLMGDNTSSKAAFDSFVTTFKEEYPRFASTQAAIDAYSTTISNRFTQLQKQLVAVPSKQVLAKENDKFNTEYYSFEDVATHVNEFVKQLQRGLPFLSTIPRSLPVLAKDEVEAEEPARYRREVGTLDDIAKKRYAIVSDLCGNMVVLSEKMAASLYETGIKLSRFDALVRNDGAPIYFTSRLYSKVCSLPTRVKGAPEQAASVEGSKGSDPKAAASGAGEKPVEGSKGSDPKAAASGAGEKPVEGSGGSDPKAAASGAGEKPVEGSKGSDPKAAASGAGEQPVEQSAEAASDSSGPQASESQGSSEQPAVQSKAAPAHKERPKAISTGSSEPATAEPRTPQKSAASSSEGVGKKPGKDPTPAEAATYASAVKKHPTQKATDKQTS